MNMILKEFKLWQWGECSNGCDLQILIQQKKMTKSNKRNLNTTKEIKISDGHSNEVKFCKIFVMITSLVSNTKIAQHPPK